MNTKTKIIVCGLLLCLLPSVAVKAQNFSRHEIRAYGSLPFGAFAKSTQTQDMVEDGVAASGAFLGAGLGYRYLWQFSWNVEFFAAADLFWNPSSPEQKDNFYNWSNETAPHYFNLPITVGMNLNQPFEKFTWYFNVAAGININQTTTTGWADNEAKFKLGFSAAVDASLGIVLSKHYDIGLSLISLTSYTVKLKDGYSDAYSINTTSGLKRNMLMGVLYIGYIF